MNSGSNTRESVRSSINRRQFVKAGAASTAAALAGCTGGNKNGGGNNGGGTSGGSSSGGNTATTKDPNDVVKGQSITVAVDSSPDVRPYRWYQDEIKKQTGISVPKNGIKTFSFGNLFEQYQNKFVTKSAPADSVIYYPRLLGTFAANGHIEPLDKYNKIWSQKLDDVMERFRVLYTTWNGKQYALPVDGDVHCLMYRKDLFEKHNVKIPETWSEFNKAAKYFTEKTDDVKYGAATYGDPSFTFGWFLDRFGGLGGKYFDEDMNPQFNTEAGRRSLKNWKETIQYCPPGVANYAYMDIRKAFTKGRVAMTVQWNDIPTKVHLPGNIGSKWGMKPVPGWSDGKAVSCMPAGRVASVPSYISEEKKLASYRFQQLMTGEKFSKQSVSDANAGQNIYRKSHDDPTLYTKPNPYRDYKDDKAKKASIDFPDEAHQQREAKEYVEMTKKTLQQGYPVPNWPGAPTYTQIMNTECSKFVAGSQGVDETLKNMDDKFSKAVKNLGKDQQKKYYQEVIKSWKKVGLWS